MGRDAFQSDTETDAAQVPSVQNFLTNTPVEKRVFVPGPRRALDRRCRAIANIMYAHAGWSNIRIARIFAVAERTTSKCVGNKRAQFYPRDEPGNDYDYAGAEFLAQFPPKELSGGNKLSDGEASGFGGENDENAAATKGDEENHPTSLKRNAPTPAARKKKPRLQGPTSTGPTNPSIEPGFISTVPASPSNVDLMNLLSSILPQASAAKVSPPFQMALLSSRGFTASSFGAMSQWAPVDVANTFQRLLLAAPGRHEGLTLDEIGALEWAVEYLRAARALADQSRSELRTWLSIFLLSTPDAKPTLKSASTLYDFLANVHGLDLSRHLPLFLARGFTIEWLRVLAGVQSSAEKEVYEILARGLQKGSSIVRHACGELFLGNGLEVELGLSPFEVIALELALKEHTKHIRRDGVSDALSDFAASHRFAFAWPALASSLFAYPTTFRFTPSTTSRESAMSDFGDRFDTLLFSSPKILSSTLLHSDDKEVAYTVNTVRVGRQKATTTLLEYVDTAEGGAHGQQVQVGTIDWRAKTFEVGLGGGERRKVHDLYTKRGTFSSSRYWSWFDQDEYKVKYSAEAEHTWTLFSYSGQAIATLTSRVQRIIGASSLPTIRILSNIQTDDERRFIILVLLYSETKRLESITERPLSMVGDLLS
uniref:DUF6593 domain-containing protein n=1 Tax=Mycena chlorophos TaxID=658473 RepID=A0ABQ0LX76_MYCCL|nr:predicted protein [Mycena chlorophos]GAT55713.1 predicted protein [Mycena chlorophos]